MNTLPTNAFTVDLEDWYQGLEIDMDDWKGFASRIEIGVHNLLGLLEESDTRATFFILGYQAEQTPDLIRDIKERGHEIASHGYSHRFVYRQRPEDFRAELRRSRDILQEITGAPVFGYRAPFFSITADSLWALDILAEEGFQYDSSVFPVMNYRYGIPGASRSPDWLTTAAGNRIYEIPLSTLRLPHRNLSYGLNIPLCGGGYFRLYPYRLTRALIRMLMRGGERLIFYVHPWEYDPGHPRIDMPRWGPKFTHYHNLNSMLRKTKQLLSDHRFGSIQDVFGSQMKMEAAS